MCVFRIKTTSPFTGPLHLSLMSRLRHNLCLLRPPPLPDNYVTSVCVCVCSCPFPVYCLLLPTYAVVTQPCSLPLQSLPTPPSPPFLPSRASKQKAAVCYSLSLSQGHSTRRAQFIFRLLPCQQDEPSCRCVPSLPLPF